MVVLLRGCPLGRAQLLLSPQHLCGPGSSLGQAHGSASALLSPGLSVTGAKGSNFASSQVCGEHSRDADRGKMVTSAKLLYTCAEPLLCSLKVCLHPVFLPCEMERVGSQGLSLSPGALADRAQSLGDDRVLSSLYLLALPQTSVVPWLTGKFG